MKIEQEEMKMMSRMNLRSRCKKDVEKWTAQVVVYWFWCSGLGR